MILEIETGRNLAVFFDPVLLSNKMIRQTHKTPANTGAPSHESSHVPKAKLTALPPSQSTFDRHFCLDFQASPSSYIVSSSLSLSLSLKNSSCLHKKQSFFSAELLSLRLPLKDRALAEQSYSSPIPSLSLSLSLTLLKTASTSKKNRAFSERERGHLPQFPLSLSLYISPMARFTNHQQAAFLQLISLILLLTSRGVESQPPPNNGSSSSNTGPYFATANFSPSMAILIVVLITAFFFLGFFSIYIRQCGGGRIDAIAAAAAAVGGRSRRQRGLDPTVLETFPTMVYSEVKEHKIGKGALECAICLNEFEDEDTIRLLPKCDHVFHQECIDSWLASHVTCPVCRTNYADGADPPAAASVAPAPPEATAAPAEPEQVVVIAVEDEEEMRELARIASRVRRNGSRRPRRLLRSHSTGHSLAMRQGEGLDRFTLRLPENIRKEIIAAGMLRRATSFAVVGAGEGSSRRVSRGIEEGSSRRGRSIRLGRSDRWPSFFVRSMSAKISAWGNWRRAEEESVKEGSLRGKIAGGAAGSKHNSADDSAESSTAVLNRV